MRSTLIKANVNQKVCRPAQMAGKMPILINIFFLIFNKQKNFGGGGERKKKEIIIKTGYTTHHQSFMMDR
jgi:hypothetical protein